MTITIIPIQATLHLRMYCKHIGLPFELQLKIKCGVDLFDDRWILGPLSLMHQKQRKVISRMAVMVSENG